MNILHKLRWSINGVGWTETLRGLGRLARRPSHITTQEGITLTWGWGLRPTLLVVTGRYVEPEYALLRDRLRDATVVDVGAGIGQFAIWAARAGARLVRAYEPTEEQLAYLILNAAENRVVVDWRKTALGEGRVEEGAVVGSGFRTRVPGWTTLDDEFPMQSIDVLKINTAGGEAGVLAGARALLAEGRVRALVVLDGWEVREALSGLRQYQWTLPERGRHWIGVRT